jgi:hypothetical protein
MVDQRNVMGAVHVLRALLDGDVGVVGLLVVGGDLLPAVVDDEEPRRRAALGQAAIASRGGFAALSVRNVGTDGVTVTDTQEESRVVTSGGRA